MHRRKLGKSVHRGRREKPLLPRIWKRGGEEEKEEEKRRGQAPIRSVGEGNRGRYPENICQRQRLRRREWLLDVNKKTRDPTSFYKREMHFGNSTGWGKIMVSGVKKIWKKKRGMASEGRRGWGITEVAGHLGFASKGGRKAERSLRGQTG